MRTPPLYCHRRRQKGNALFLILIAVALFAALSYAITQSGRGGNPSTSKEQMELAFAEVQGAIGLMQTAVNRMILSGVDPARLEANTDGAGGNANCLDTSCQLFHKDGGGLPRLLIKNQAAWAEDSDPPYHFYSQLFDGVTVFNQVWLLCTFWYDTLGRPRYLIARFNTNRDFCLYYNSKLGITGDPVDTPSAMGIYNVKVGWMTQLGNGDGIANPFSHAAHMTGREEGCLYSGGGYRIVSVVYKP